MVARSQVCKATARTLRTKAWRAGNSREHGCGVLAHLVQGVKAAARNAKADASLFSPDHGQPGAHRVACKFFDKVADCAAEARKEQA
eukprot:2242056-Pleurochrysis_carterae.AAC.1